MSLRIRRGTDAQRQGTQFDLGEPVFTTDTGKLYIGDGVTQGANNILATSAGIGLSWNATTQKLDCTVTGGGGGIASVSQDTAPTLGGNLTLNSHNIQGTGNINISGSITGTSLLTSNLSFTNNVFSISSGSLYVQNNNQDMVQFRGVNTTGSVANTPQFNLFSSRGTVSSPTDNQAGDSVISLNFGGYHDSTYQQINSIVSLYDPSANMTSSTPNSNLALITQNNSGTYNTAYFSYNGVFGAPIFQTGSYTTTQINSIPSPQAGMMIFNSTAGHFYGYNGTAWVAFTGP